MYKVWLSQEANIRNADNLAKFDQCILGLVSSSARKATLEKAENLTNLDQSFFLFFVFVDLVTWLRRILRMQKFKITSAENKELKRLAQSTSNNFLFSEEAIFSFCICGIWRREKQTKSVTDQLWPTSLCQSPHICFAMDTFQLQRRLHVNESAGTGRTKAARARRTYRQPSRKLKLSSRQLRQHY